MNPTRDQLQARELIATYEGASRVTCDFDGYYYVVETDTGSRWMIDRNAERIVGPNRRQYDLCELESRISNPADFEVDNPLPDDFDYLTPYEAPGSVTDFHSDREAELRALDRAEIDDQQWLTQQERRFAY